MSLTDQIDRPTKKEYIDKKGPYLFRVINGYDSNVVEPDSKTRYFELVMRAEKPVRDHVETETDEQLKKRKNQIGRTTTGRIYVSAKTFSSAVGLLFGIAGYDEEFPEEFDEKARQKDESGEPDFNSSGEPLYDMQYAAENVPINVSQLEDRMFVGYLDYGQKGRYLQLQMFDSYAVEEEYQEVGPRDIFQGEDTWSPKQKKRKSKKNNSRSEAVDSSVLEEETFEPDDELPF